MFESPEAMRLGIRSAGVLLHPTCLPGPHGIGDLGPKAHEFARTLSRCGQSWWQVLPVAPPGFGESPYNALSAFAGNPLLISLDALAEQGLLPGKLLDAPGFPEERVDFSAVQSFKLPRLREAFERFEAEPNAPSRRDFQLFRASNAFWLEDYALFCALRQVHAGAPWTQWEAGLRSRRESALEKARRSFDAEIRFHAFLQHRFSLQWRALRRRCQELGVGLIGDIPIFVSHDSADVWSHPELFALDKRGQPTLVAGVPPDYFSKTGQRWGNPLYRWNAMARDGYAWWISRFRRGFEHFDSIRLDHFIGFHNYWEIPASCPTAERGRWVLAPGQELFCAVKKKLGALPFIAEDLGVVTPQVRALRDRFGFPGLRVLQMAFGTDADADIYKPHNHPRHCVVYTGTHDNDTTAGWFNDQSSATSTRTKEEIGRERAAILGYLGTDGSDVHWDMIRLALMSVADTAVIPVQDLLGLGSEARMNLPGTSGGNWAWRMKDGALTEEIQRRWAELTRIYGRAGSGAAGAGAGASKRRSEGVIAAAKRMSAPPKATA